MADFRFVIIEDEAAAAARLRKLVLELRPAAEHLHTLDTVEAAVEWLEENPEAYDLLLMDVQLADGISFEIFQEVKVQQPVIFTTAYDAYALQAFRVNGLDYLLKPIKSEELKQALERFDKLRKSSPALDYHKLAEMLRPSEKSYQKRLLVKIGETFKALDVQEAAYFYAHEKVIFLRQHTGREYPLDHNLDQLEALLDPAQFFRINRQYIINIKAIQSMHAWSKSRLKLVLQPEPPGETVVSTYRTGDFKAWLEAK